MCYEKMGVQMRVPDPALAIFKRNVECNCVYATWVCSASLRWSRYGEGTRRH